MAILQSKTKSDPMEIPPELRRAPNGKASPSVDELLAKIAALEAQVARKSTLTLKVSDKRTKKADAVAANIIGTLTQGIL